MQNSISDYYIYLFFPSSHQAIKTSKCKYKVEKMAQILLTWMGKVLIYGDVNNRS